MPTVIIPEILSRDTMSTENGLGEGANRSEPPNPLRWGSKRTLIAEGGRDQDISQGDEFTVTHEGQEYDVEVIQVSNSKSILRVDDLDVPKHESSSFTDQVRSILF